MTQTGSGSATQSTGPHPALRRRFPEDPAGGTDGAPGAPVGTPPTGDPVLTGDPGLPGTGLRETGLPEAVLPAVAPPAAVVSEPEPADQQPRVDRCRAERAERRQRRRISMGCALLVAVCLVITILIVGMARNRNPGAQVVVPGLSLTAAASFDSLPTVDTVHPVQTVQTDKARGAVAPEGGNR
jgi:predicted nucleic acid-binding Zn ribbon protein